MNPLAKKLAEEALTLPADDRAALVDVLLRSLRTAAEEEIDRLCAEEAEKRVKELEDGTGIPRDNHKGNANPWLPLAGMFEGDQMFEEVLQEIEADRRRLDAEERLT